MMVSVKLFAVARQLAGSETVELDLPEGATVGHVREALTAKVPELERIAGHLLFAVDAQYAADGVAISPGSDVACIPPVSGG